MARIKIIGEVVERTNGFHFNCYLHHENDEGSRKTSAGTNGPFFTREDAMSKLKDFCNSLRATLMENLDPKTIKSFYAKKWG